MSDNLYSFSVPLFIHHFEILSKILKKGEINWLNNYHKNVYKNLKKFMNKSELSDLKQACSKI